MANAQYQLRELMQPLGGLCTVLSGHSSGVGEPSFETRLVSLGNVSHIAGAANKPIDAPRRRPTMSGAGTAREVSTAEELALAEAVERYCTCVYSVDHFTVASATDLGRDALDLDVLPACSETELAHAKCPLSRPDKLSPIRWVKGISLLSGRTTFLPVVVVYMNTGYISPRERIALPITTGCAAFTSYEGALLRAILEVVERDAISLTWLQKLPLPRLEIDTVPDDLKPFWDRYGQRARDLEYVFFDATTDIGVCTVYGLQLAKNDARVRTLVTCATDIKPARAVAKVIRDMTFVRQAFRQERRVPDSWDDFADLLDGATYMARAQQSDAFAFLLESGTRHRLSEMPDSEHNDDRAALASVLSRFRDLNLEVYAVDLTADEAIRCGLRVVRAVVPALQPLSFHYRARYLGHPRVYEAPTRMGYRSYAEAQLNHLPQPFA